MSYDYFSECKIGDVKELFLDFGMIRFVKCSKHQFLVEVALMNDEPFIYTRFTQVMPTIEASVLFDKYEKIGK